MDYLLSWKVGRGLPYFVITCTYSIVTLPKFLRLCESVFFSGLRVFLSFLIGEDEMGSAIASNSTTFPHRILSASNSYLKTDSLLENVSQKVIENRETKKEEKNFETWSARKHEV